MIKKCALMFTVFKVLMTMLFFQLLDATEDHLATQDHVIDTYNDPNLRVDLMRRDKINPLDHPFGSDIYVVNHNDFAIDVSAKLIEADNMKDGILTDLFQVPAGQQGYIGWVAIDRADKPGRWNISWAVNKHVELNKSVEPSKPSAEPSKPSVGTSQSSVDDIKTGKEVSRPGNK